MKRILLPLFIGSLTISAQAQIANGSFETWTKVLLFEHPSTSSLGMSSNYDTYFDNGVLSATKVQQDDNKVLRIENVQGSDAVMPGYFIFGETPTDGLVFVGGSAISDLNMTGIAMDLKYDMLEGSEGSIIIQFKDGNTPVGEGNHGVGTYLFPISGTEDWSNKVFEFEYPIHHTADRCVIGIASGDLINDDMPYVVGSFIEVDNIAFVGSEDLIMGGDFEAWSQVEPAMVPESCVVEIHPFSQNYAQSSHANQGSYAVKLKTISADQGATLNIGSLLLGNKDSQDQIVPTIEIGQNEMVSFMYSYSATGDLGQAKVVFYDEANGLESVLEQVIELTPTSGYELIEFSFRSILQELDIAATHMSIEFRSSVETAEIPAKLGSSLLVDDVELQMALSTKMINPPKFATETTLRSYPNPTIGRVVFTFIAPRTGYYRVYKYNGAQIAIREFSSAKEVHFDLSSYPAGLYLFKFYHNSGMESSRVVKN